MIEILSTYCDRRAHKNVGNTISRITFLIVLLIASQCENTCFGALTLEEQVAAYKTEIESLKATSATLAKEIESLKGAVAIGAEERAKLLRLSENLAESQNNLSKVMGKLQNTGESMQTVKTIPTETPTASASASTPATATTSKTTAAATETVTAHPLSSELNLRDRTNNIVVPKEGKPLTFTDDYGYRVSVNGHGIQLSQGTGSQIKLSNGEIASYIKKNGPIKVGDRSITGIETGLKTEMGQYVRTGSEEKFVPASQISPGSTLVADQKVTLTNFHGAEVTLKRSELPSYLENNERKGIAVLKQDGTVDQFVKKKDLEEFRSKLPEGTKTIDILGSDGKKMTVNKDQLSTHVAGEFEGQTSVVRKSPSGDIYASEKMSAEQLKQFASRGVPTTGLQLKDSAGNTTFEPEKIALDKLYSKDLKVTVEAVDGKFLTAAEAEKLGKVTYTDSSGNQVTRSIGDGAFNSASIKDGKSTTTIDAASVKDGGLGNHAITNADGSVTHTDMLGNHVATSTVEKTKVQDADGKEVTSSVTKWTDAKGNPINAEPDGTLKTVGAADENGRTLTTYRDADGKVARIEENIPGKPMVTYENDGAGNLNKLKTNADGTLMKDLSGKNVTVLNGRDEPIRLNPEREANRAKATAAAEAEAKSAESMTGNVLKSSEAEGMAKIAAEEKEAQAIAAAGEKGGKKAPNPPAVPNGAVSKIETDMMNANAAVRKSKDRCSTSATINGELGCSDTYSLAQTSNQMSMMMMMMGGGQNTSAGSSVNANLSADAQNTSVQAAAQKAAADLAVRSAETQAGIGGANAAMGLMLLSKMKTHESNADNLLASGGSELIQTKLEGGTKYSSGAATSGVAGFLRSNDTDGYQQDIINNFKINQRTNYSEVKEATEYKVEGKNQTEIKENQLKAQKAAQDQREVEMKRAKGSAQGEVEGYADQAAEEQRSAAAEAKNASLMPMMMGITQLLAAKSSYDAAQQMKAQANALGATSSMVAQGSTTLPGIPQNTDGGNSGGVAAAVTGDGSNPNPSPDPSTSPSSIAAPNLGLGGLGPNTLPSDTPSGLPGGSLNPGQNQGGGGGGGGGGFDGGGGTSAADAGPPDQTQGSLSGDQVSRAGYEASGGVSSSRIGGGGGGPKGADPISALLEGLLVKKNDPTVDTRGIVFDEQKTIKITPLLGKDADLFKRITTTIKDKASHGEI